MKILKVITQALSTVNTRTLTLRSFLFWFVLNNKTQQFVLNNKILQNFIISAAGQDAWIPLCIQAQMMRKEGAHDQVCVCVRLDAERQRERERERQRERER
jgi:hypothetical protein